MKYCGMNRSGQAAWISGPCVSSLQMDAYQILKTEVMIIKPMVYSKSWIIG